MGGRVAGMPRARHRPAAKMGSTSNVQPTGARLIFHRKETRDHADHEMKGGVVMQHENVLEMMRRAVRTEICPTCFKREPFADGSNPTSPRPREARRCEESCNIFRNLPSLKKIAQQSARDPSVSLEDELMNRICLHCDTSESAGDYCVDRTNRQCPLARYSFDVVELLERVASAAQHQGAKKKKSSSAEH